MLVGKVKGPQAVEADDRDDLFVEHHRHRDLALDHLGNLPVEPAGAFLLVGIDDQVRPPGVGHVAGKAALLRGQVLASDPDRRDVLFQPLLALGPDQAAVGFLDHQPELAVLFPDQGDAAGVGADQFRRLGKDAAQKGLQPLELFLQQVIDFGEDLDFHVLPADLLDHPLGHLGVGLQQPFLKIVESVGAAGIVVDQADHPPGERLVARHHVQRLQSHLLGQVAFLQALGGQIGDVQGREQGVVDDHSGVADVPGKQGLAGPKLDQPLILVEPLGLLLHRIGGENLQPLLATARGQLRRDQHRSQRELVDQPHRRFDHVEGRLLFLGLIHAPGQHDLLMVLAGLVDDRRHLFQNPLEQAPPLLVGQLPRTAAVDAQHADRSSLVQQRQQAAGADAEPLGQLAGKGALEPGDICHQRLLLGNIDPRDHVLLAVDGKGLIADGIAQQAAGLGAGQAAVGEIFKINPAAVLAGDQVDRLDHHVQDVVEVFLAVAADFTGQALESGQ